MITLPTIIPFDYSFPLSIAIVEPTIISCLGNRNVASQLVTPLQVRPSQNLNISYSGRMPLEFNSAHLIPFLRTPEGLPNFFDVKSEFHSIYSKAFKMVSEVIILGSYL